MKLNKTYNKRVAIYIYLTSYTKCCQVQSDTSTEKLDIFQHIRTQKVLNFEQFSVVYNGSKKLYMSKNGIEQ